jgi:hypothetical protein
VEPEPEETAAEEPAVDETQPEEPAEPVTPEVAAEEEPEEIDPVISLEPLPPIIGCDQETFDRLSHCFKNGFIKEELRPWERKKLKDEFDEANYEKIPILLNAFNGLDLLKPNDVVIAFRVAEMWNKLTGEGFVDVPIKGDTDDELMAQNLNLNVKNINAIYKIWRNKVDDVEAQRSFFAKCDKYRAKAAEKEASDE